MIYCVVMVLSQGLVFVVDLCINVGVDQIVMFCKLYKFQVFGEWLIVMMIVGNLVIIQSVFSLLCMWLYFDCFNLFGVIFLYEVVIIVGVISCEVVSCDVGFGQGNVDFGSSFIVGGQINGEVLWFFLVYLEGNFIECFRDMLYFQIGEIKYGKLIIDWVVDFDMLLDSVVQCVLLSLDFIICFNLFVGLLLDVFCYFVDSFSDVWYYNVDDQYEGFWVLGEVWFRGLWDVFQILLVMCW